MRENFLGSILGLAAGDALGAPVEFKRPGTFKPLTDMVGDGSHGLQAGEWTDDTSMALCLAESLISCKGFDARDQMERYLRWYRDGVFPAVRDLRGASGVLAICLPAAFVGGWLAWPQAGHFAQSLAQGPA